jgi:hypothetical protein
MVMAIGMDQIKMAAAQNTAAMPHNGVTSAGRLRKKRIA